VWGRLTAERPLLLSCIKALLLFLVCLGALVILLRTLLPPIDPEDAPSVKIPKSFDDLKNLNRVLQVRPNGSFLCCLEDLTAEKWGHTQIYKERNFYRVLGSFVVVYLFLQAFSLPGSMYLSILAGALWGVFKSLVLVCFVRFSPFTPETGVLRGSVRLTRGILLLVSVSPPAHRCVMAYQP
jgi:hypothetical protein